MRAALALLALIVVARAEETVPSEADFSKVVLSVVKAYPTDGTHKYYWPKGDDWPGTTCDVEYQGVKACEADAEKRCYCCGLTWEVFVRAWKAWSEAKKLPFAIPGVEGQQIVDMRSDWFGSTGDKKSLIQHAVVSRGLGRAITRLEDARPGDFVQFWRNNGTGHSVIFLEWNKGGDGKLKALTYWSTQKSTDGIGEREERLSGDDGIDPAQVYIVRVGRK